MKLKICHLYPDVLNLYGDGGNIRCLMQRLRWRGMEAELVKLPIGSRESLAGADLVFIGGGQDFEQQVLLGDLHRGRDKELCAAIEDGVTVLAICGGYQMLGAYYETLLRDPRRAALRLHRGAGPVHGRREKAHDRQLHVPLRRRARRHDGRRL